MRVYIYYKDWRNSVLSREHEKRHAALEKHCARFAKIANHSKCVVQDHTKVAISSNNWLDDTYEGSINRSLVISGLATETLIEAVWQGIRFYQSIEYDNDAGMAHFLRNRDAFSTGSYQFHPGEFYYTLRTPDAHQQLWEQEILAKAQREILMCSPFIRIEKLKRVLAEAAMRSLEERGVRTHLFTLFDPCSRAPMEKDEIFEYLQMLTRKFPHFSFSPQQNLHAKTLIADDLLCEGSFNLLSAVDDIEHNANNFEMSVAIRGPIAAPFIAAFHESPLGAAVLPMDFFGAPPPGSAAAVTATPAAIASPPAAYTPPRSIVSTIRTPSSSLILSSPSRAFSSSPQHSTPPEIRIFSGRTFYKEGYCATLEGEYIRDLEGRIAYFSTPQIARQVAEEVWKDEGESWDSDDDFFQ
ncbi:MAG: hypothetical protein HYX35_03360 [Proteobacteria bacterium]|nr:hypothetical protein [Pseudomonadota bacterium]